MADKIKLSTAQVEAGGCRWPMAQLHQRWFGDGHNRICYLEGGVGWPVVFLHGGASDSRDWVPVMAQLSADYHVLAPDLPGFGKSSNSREQYRVVDFTTSVADFIEKTCDRPVALLGHSLGGRVAIELAWRRPALVERMVLVDSAGFGEVTRLGSFIIKASDFLRRCCRRPKPYPDFDPDDLRRPKLCLEKLPSVAQPTMLIWGLFDPYYPVGYARKAVTLLPDARLEVLVGCRHAPHKERPGVVAGLLAEFLQDLKR
ncbi:MAG: alpha/beta hydrolase [Dehalococcoidia bacterium]|nr:alpha/beta hydrolase [Dehalococcoidia bacterium]